MERLPPELLAQITSYLEPGEIVPLHGVSRRLRLGIRHDDLLWKQFVYDHSQVERMRLSRLGLAGDLNRLPASQVQATSKQEVSRRWDKLQPLEIDWYNEYIQRHAPASLSWLEQTLDSGDARATVEVRGMGMLRQGDGGRVVAPLEDGSVAVWDLRDVHVTGKRLGYAECASSEGTPASYDISDSRLGRVLGRSSPGILSSRRSSEHRRKTPLAHAGIVESVSVNHEHSRAFFGVHSYLHEVDLNTLQIVSRTRFPFTIAALSETGSSNPLMVATNMSLHMLDTRSPRSSTASLAPRDHQSAYATLFKPGWLSVLHSADRDGHVYLAGRDSHIISYDRKMWPKISRTIHSGASLACLATISRGTSWSLAACGEYKGRGSLELYDVSAKTPPLVNRQTASSSKLLSVVQHGSRIAFSDADGIIKWMDMDGVTEERRFSVNNFEQTRGTPYGSFDIGAEVVRKLSTVGEPTSQYANRNDLLLWTGERIGLLSFRSWPRFEANAKAQVDEEHQREDEYISAFSGTLHEHLNAVNLLPLRLG